jgi:ATP-binding cassette subfamily C protein
MRFYLADLAILLDGCRGRLAAAFALFAASAAMDLACMAVLPIFVFAALSPEPLALPWLDASFGAISGFALSVAVVALFVVRAGFMLVVGAGMSATAEAVRERVVGRLVQELLASPYEAASRRAASDEITAATQYATTFSLNVVMPLLRLALDIVTILAVLAFVARLEPQVVLGAAAVFAMVGLAYFAGVRGITARNSRRATDLQAELHRQVGQALSSPREVRVYGLRQYFWQRIAESLRGTARAHAWLGAVYWFPRALGELTLIGLAIAYMIVKSRAGVEAALVVSNLSVLGFAGLRLLPAFAQGMTNLGYLQGGRRVTRILADKLRSPPPAAALTGQPGVAPPAPAGEALESLALERVSFRFEGAEQDALREVSFVLRRGQSAGVVGPSGAGKSTLGDLLLGLLVPRQGRILLNGQPAALDSQRWWDLVGFVPQSPYIANDSLIRNIAYGVAEARIDRAAVRRALQLAQLEEVAARLPQGLDTLLGDQGVRLSGGQRQRVAIARALYYRRDFLVLDEATSALDAETEQEVIGAIEALKGTITTFIIAHRLSTLQNCDFIIELRDGRVAEMRSYGARESRSPRNP